jgi:quinol monooxygenase YgiN
VLSLSKFARDCRVMRTTVRSLADEGGHGMWAQLITVRLKPGKEGDLPRLVEELKATEQPDSGLVRSSALQDQNDPSRVHMLVVFESEQKARERENDPRRDEGLRIARATMAEIFDGPPEFTDLSVVADWMP